MLKRRDKKGFTLIELAIVLVIIGLIIGAVLKGADLIDNAKAKKFITKARGWEVSQWTYLDRKGGFAGDDNKNGKIGGATGNPAADFVAASFTNPPYEGGGTPINTITMGSLTFYVFFGTDGGADTGLNILTICSDNACGAFTEAELLYIKSLDVAIDGTADGANGQLIGVSSAPAITAAEWEAGYASAPTAAAWTAATTQAAVYYFDGQP